MPKTAWAKHLYNAYNSVKAGDDVYDLSKNGWTVTEFCDVTPRCRE